MSAFQATRAQSSYTHAIAASASVVFPLLCPVKEYDWIDGWTCRMIYSDSGVAENNCIFTTSFPRGMEEVWVVSHYDPANYAIQFVVTNPNMYVLKFDISLQADGDGSAIMQCTNTITGLSDKGNAFIAQYTAAAEPERMALLFKTLDHYCRTRKMLKKSALLGALHAAFHRA